MLLIASSCALEHNAERRAEMMRRDSSPNLNTPLMTKSTGGDTSGAAKSGLSAGIPASIILDPKLATKDHVEAGAYSLLFCYWMFMRHNYA